MAEQKPTLVLSPAFSTILSACGVDRVTLKIDAVTDRAEQDVRFKRTHGMSRKDWDAALSLHLHGELQ